MPKASELKRGMIVDIEGIPHVVRAIRKQKPFLPRCNHAL